MLHTTSRGEQSVCCCGMWMLFQRLSRWAQSHEVSPWLQLYCTVRLLLHSWCLQTRLQTCSKLCQAAHAHHWLCSNSCLLAPSIITGWASSWCHSIAQLLLQEGLIKREDIHVTTKLWNDRHGRDQVIYHVHGHSSHTVGWPRVESGQKRPQMCNHHLGQA